MNINVKRVKICVTVPRDNTEDVRDAMCKAGAGTLTNSNYTYCSICSDSIGTFIPNDNAKPYIGEKNKLEVVVEHKLEVICEIDKVKNVIAALREAHPYEEPAIDIIPLLNEEDF